MKDIGTENILSVAGAGMLFCIRKVDGQWNIPLENRRSPTPKNPGFLGLETRGKNNIIERIVKGN
jgi:hypothetical protein